MTEFACSQDGSHFLKSIIFSKSDYQMTTDPELQFTHELGHA